MLYDICHFYRPRFPWGGRFLFGSRKKTEEKSEPPCAPPRPQTPPPNRVSKKSSAIDRQTYIDTQSPGLASRVVKYYEESQEKQRQLTNPLYTRFGDLPLAYAKPGTKPIQRMAAAVKSTVNVVPSPPRNNYMGMEARAMIMSTGRIGCPVSTANGSASNDATTYQNAANTGGRPANLPNENEPLVTHDDEYSSAPTRSSLDALHEISRKRIHCQDIDNEQTKKSKADLMPIQSANAAKTDPLGTGALSMKRGREQISPPSTKSANNDTKKKSRRCNDIFSSLSSSAHMLAPKRKLSESFYFS